MSKNTDSQTPTAATGATLGDALAAGDRHLLVNGDALNPNALDKGSVDLIVASPSYNVGKRRAGDSEDDAMGFDDYLEFTRQWLDNRCAWTKPTGRICVNVSIDKNKNGKTPLSAHLTLAALQVGWKRHATILWNEGDISRRAAWGSWKSASAPRVIAPADFDIVRCDPRRPAVSSAEASLRERCKQADSEGIAPSLSQRRILPNRPLERQRIPRRPEQDRERRRGRSNALRPSRLARLRRPARRAEDANIPLSEAIEPLASGIAAG